MRQRLHDSLVSAAGERVFVVERRAGDLDQHLARRELIDGRLLDAARDGAVVAAADHQAGEGFVRRHGRLVHACTKDEGAGSSERGRSSLYTEAIPFALRAKAQAQRSRASLLTEVELSCECFHFSFVGLLALLPTVVRAEQAAANKSESELLLVEVE